jgi:hypothetical protein
LGGSGILYSLNYERQATAASIIARVGFTFLLPQTIAFPVTLGKVFGKKNHHLEINAGILIANSQQTQSNNSIIRITSIHGSGFIGYRYQKPDKRLFYRAGFSFLHRKLILVMHSIMNPERSFFLGQP